ncbi:hypothetical protein EAI_16871 [Harpegnathos saltator]|uniref:Uncharacterized protein n=1 Tax=Harpegnathos saltator TaxID=610380 RepID=E2BP37_HARSA|nr:hypothetical protein EAI_16871 [Harpegnathos saltator]
MEEISARKYVSEGSTVRDCVSTCVEKEAWSTRTYCCQQDGCNSGPSLTASSGAYFVLAISLAVLVMCRSLRG